MHIVHKLLDHPTYTVPKFSDTRKLCCNLPKIQTKSPNLRVFSQEDDNGIANSEDRDQTAQTHLSENLGSLGYTYIQSLKEDWGLRPPCQQEVRQNYDDQL